MLCLLGRFELNVCVFSTYNIASASAFYTFENLQVHILPDGFNATVSRVRVGVNVRFSYTNMVGTGFSNMQ